MSQASWTLSRPDGVELGIHELGNGPPVVLVHGTACDHRVWARVARRLAAGFTVHVLDRRGRATSGGEAQWSIATDARDVGTLANRLGDDVPVVGHSLGAIVALEAALEEDAIGPIVAYEPPIVGEDGPGVEAADELARVLEQEGPAAVVEAFLREVGYEDEQLGQLQANEELWQATLGTASTIPPEARAVLGYEVDDARMSEIDQAVLLLDGENSPPDFEAALQRLAKAIPRARRASVAGAKHAVLYEAPGRLTEQIQAFLDEHA